MKNVRSINITAAYEDVQLKLETLSITPRMKQQQVSVVGAQLLEVL